MIRDAALSPRTAGIQDAPGRFQALAGSRLHTVATALFAFALGALILTGTGFAQSHFFHDSAHDTRHSINFPCH